MSAGEGNGAHDSGAKTIRCHQHQAPRTAAEPSTMSPSAPRWKGAAGPAFRVLMPPSPSALGLGTYKHTVPWLGLAAGIRSQPKGILEAAGAAGAGLISGPLCRSCLFRPPVGSRGCSSGRCPSCRTPPKCHSSAKGRRKNKKSTITSQVQLFLLRGPGWRILGSPSCLPPWPGSCRG